MAICATVCKIPPYAWAAGCKKDLRNGGIPYFVFFSCDILTTIPNFGLDDFSDIADWCTGITAGDIAISPVLVGKKDAASFVNKRTDSCAPERPIGASRSISFMSLQVDNTAVGARTVQFTDVDFWNDTFTNQASLLAGYIDCFGRFYGILDDFALEVSETKEDNSAGTAQWEGKLSWQGTLELKPWLVQGLVQDLLSACV